MSELPASPEGRGPDHMGAQTTRRRQKPPDYDFGVDTQGPSLLDWRNIDSTMQLWARTDSGCISLVSLVVVGFACFVFFTILLYIR